jgi:hypothetical protein
MMTEAEWLTSTDPEKMLSLFTAHLNNRKLRLFACACCRHIWPLLKSKSARRAIEVAEAFADGRATKEELRTARRATRNSRVTGTWAAAAWALDQHQGIMLASCAYRNAAAAAKAGWGSTDEKKVQADLLRCIFGNPFGPQPLNSNGRPKPIGNAILEANDGAVYNLMLDIYYDRAFESMPVLADALEDAGCTDMDMIAHCRESVHARGCWVVDMALLP